MTYGLYAAISILAVSFVHLLIGSWKRLLLQSFFLHVIYVDNNRHLISQMNPTKKNMTNLDLNLGQLVCLVPDCVGFCML